MGLRLANLPLYPTQNETQKAHAAALACTDDLERRLGAAEARSTAMAAALHDVAVSLGVGEANVGWDQEFGSFHSLLHFFILISQFSLLWSRAGTGRTHAELECCQREGCEATAG